MTQPIDTVQTYTNEITLCFREGSNPPLAHKYTSKWKLYTGNFHNGRRFWYQENPINGDYMNFMYYDSIWRYWVINHRFTEDENEWDLRCVRWDEFEPFNCMDWFTRDGDIVNMAKDCTLEPTQSPTPHPTVGCIEYNKYVYVESPVFTNQVLQSQEVNFPPYKSHTFHHVSLVIFEEMTHSTGNPCDSSTWAHAPSYYDNHVVMIRYSSFYQSLCSPQQWTLQLQNYANVIAVIVGNDADFTHTYSLAGDDALTAPTIPTRMISQMAATLLEHTIGNMNEAYITFGCFDETIDYPSTICLVDTTIVGDNVYLDGEYQRQAMEVNNHPIWLKEGHIGLWNKIYMYLDIDTSVSGEPSWKWVIGTDYNNRDSIIAECDLNGRHIDHPALCDLDWSINGSLVSNISTRGNQCSLGDNYVCVESASGGFFESYFNGRYRQTHSGVSLWLLESQTLDAHIRIAQITWPNVFGPTAQYVFAFMVNQTDIYAFCVIGESYPTQAQALAPYKCNKDWYVIDYDYTAQEYKWILDLAFDVDQCTHANLTTTAAVINYPQTLCLSDSSNTYSHFQGHYGIYTLDTTQTFDGRYVYKNQRLDGIEGNEWYMLWYEEKDAWVINEMIPGETIVRTTEGICRENVDTPDLCVNECWEFFEAHAMISRCSVSASIATSNVESDCIGILPVNNIIHNTKEINLCFDDGVTSDPWKDNKYTGKWYLDETDTYGGRAYWYKLSANALPNEKLIGYYMFYDPYYRYWMIDTHLGRSEENGWDDGIHYYCLHWDEFEPFNCETWYSIMSHTWDQLTMTANCVSPAPTATPTAAPTISCDARNAWIDIDTDNYVWQEETVTSMYTNFAPYMYDTFGKKELVIFENNRVMEQHSSNPCDYYTWKEYPTYYQNKVVLIKYDPFIASLCSPELWTLNIEKYANGDVFAVLISNSYDLYHVFPLAGIADADLYSNAVIPTRMIPQFAGNSIEAAMRIGENIYITLGCFDDVNGIEYPPIICLVDTSIMGKHVYLDGEYQRQNSIIKNQHPVWMKKGFEGVWQNIYMWLSIDQSMHGMSSWKWVIGTDYNTRHSIIAECVNYNQQSIENPALCDGHWYIGGKLEGNITTSDTICELGDNYVCVESAQGGLFDHYFDGQYRQIHSGISLWFLEDSELDAYLTIGQVTYPGLFENEYAFAFMLNNTEMFAFCPLGQEEPSREVALFPQNCNKNWYKLEILQTGYTWVEDFAFDIDACTHELLSTPAPKYVKYPHTLCINDDTNEYSQYQSHYGIYAIDTQQTYDGKYVYYNQRLAADTNINTNWYLLWYDEKDAWVINEMVPDITVVRYNEAICRATHEVWTPDLCDVCWEFADSEGTYENNCNVKVSVMDLDTYDESECMMLPINNTPNDYINTIILGFDDGTTGMDENVYSGIWRLAAYVTYNDRAYWYKYNANHDGIAYFMFYDEAYRFWVIDRTLGSTDKSLWHLYCLHWREFQPFECETWYTNTIGFTMKMDNTYQLPIETTAATTINTQSTSSNTETIINDVSTSKRDVSSGKSASKSGINPVVYIGCSIGLAALCGGLLCIFCYCKKHKKQRFMFKDVSKDGTFKTVYGVSQNNEDENINLNMVQMGNVQPPMYDMNRLRMTQSATLTAGSTMTKGTKGEHIKKYTDDDIHDSDDDIVTPIIPSGNEGNHAMTGNQNNNMSDAPSNKKPKNWVKFEE